MSRFLVAVLFAMTLTGCTSESDTRRALTAAGYTNIEIHGFAWLSCSEDDQFKTRFTATGPSGRPASGAVCSSWFKGSTIRLD